MATQMDVANRAAVSTATVSRVLNHSGSISQDVKARVLTAIDELNYIRDAGARALAMQRSRTLGAIIPTLNNAIFAEGINAFERTAQALGYTLILSVSQQDLDHEHDLVIKMIERGVDGLLLVGNRHNDVVYRRLDQTGVRYVCTWAYDDNDDLANVGFDNKQAMHSIVDHLVGLGHRQIAMLAGCSKDNDRAMDRITGVRDRLASHGLTLPANRVIEVPYSIAESRKAFSAITSSAVTALICGNDVIAYGALLEAQKRGVDVPGDLSITGFDDLSLSAELSPALTTVQVGAESMGEAAAQKLIFAVDNQLPVESILLHTELVVRETTARVPV
ncbi:MAG: LacI family transcriptional regulator [Pseudomonadales bacterium]|jgi:LacI family transcriptional regulator